jgi:hypothetical protein
MVWLSYQGKGGNTIFCRKGYKRRRALPATEERRKENGGETRASLSPGKDAAAERSSFLPLRHGGRHIIAPEYYK